MKKNNQQSAEIQQRWDNRRVLNELKSHLPEGITTKNRTTVLKEVKKANSGETPRTYWTCWCTDEKGNKFIALYTNGVMKLIPESEKAKYSIHAVK